MRHLYFLIFVLGGFWSFGQSDVIETDGKGGRDIEKSVRISVGPKIYDSIKTSPVSARTPLFLKTNTVITLDTIRPAIIEIEPLLEKYYPCYFKLGLGSTLMPLGEFHYNSTRSRNQVYGVKLYHQSFFGNIKDRDKNSYAPAGFDRTGLSGNFLALEQRYVLNSSFNYDNYGFHYYGFPQENANADSIRQRFQTVNGGLSVTTKRGDTSVLNFKTDLNLRWMGTSKPFEDSLFDRRVKEGGFDFQTLGYMQKRNDLFYGSIGVRHNNYKFGTIDTLFTGQDSSLFQKNTIIDFKPGVKSAFTKKRLQVDAGFGLSIDIAEKTRAYLYPNIEAKYAMLNDLIVPFVKLKGGVIQNTFASIADQNPYITTRIPLKNEIHPYDVSLGIKGSLSQKMSYGLSAQFIKIYQKAFFVNDTLSAQKFSVIYDSLNQTKIEGFITFETNQKLKITALGRFNSCEMFNEARAWNLPKFEFMVRANYNIFNKFLLSADCELALNRYAKVDSSVLGSQLENNQHFKDLGALIDANLSIEYRYSSRLSAYLNVQNLAAQRYFRWNSYPVMPIQIVAGITARF